MRTIAQVLKTANLGDVLTNGKLYWKVNSKRMDECLVASPITKAGLPKMGGFEIWSSGIEDVAVIPGLKVVK